MEPIVGFFFTFALHTKPESSLCISQVLTDHQEA